jgi:hypothetical protein
MRLTNHEIVNALAAKAKIKTTRTNYAISSSERAFLKDNMLFVDGWLCAFWKGNQFWLSDQTMPLNSVLVRQTQHRSIPFGTFVHRFLWYTSLTNYKLFSGSFKATNWRSWKYRNPKTTDLTPLIAEAVKTENKEPKLRIRHFLSVWCRKNFDRLADLAIYKEGDVYLNGRLILDRETCYGNYDKGIDNNCMSCWFRFGCVAGNIKDEINNYYGTDKFTKYIIHKGTTPRAKKFITAIKRALCSKYINPWHDNIKVL